MPYQSTEDLPATLRHLPAHAQEIYKEAYNSAWDQYDKPEGRRGNVTREETAHRVAWSAVKKIYRKDNRIGEWVEKRSKRHQRAS